jgi:hypothetical protein
MNKSWEITIEGKKYSVEVDYGAFIQDAESTQEVVFQRDGSLAVDGVQIITWKEDLPKEIAFEIGGKPAVLRKKGLFTKQLELFLGGQQIKASPNK